MANLSGKITGLVHALQRERQDTVQFIVLAGNNGRGAPSRLESALLNQDYAVSSGWADQVKSLANGIDGSYPALAQGGRQWAVRTHQGLPGRAPAAGATRVP